MSMMINKKVWPTMAILMMSAIQVACSDARAPLIAEATTPVCARRKIEGDYIVKYVNRGFHRRQLSNDALDSVRHDPAVEWVEPNYRLPVDTGLSRKWTYAIHPNYIRLIGAEGAQMAGIKGNGLTVASVDWRHTKESAAVIQEMAPESLFIPTELQPWEQSEFNAIVAVRTAFRRGARIIDVGPMSACSRAMRRSVEAWQNLDAIFVHTGEGEGLNHEKLENFVNAGPDNLSTALLAGAMALAWSTHPELGSKALISAYSRSEPYGTRAQDINVAGLLNEVQMTLRSSLVNLEK